MTSCLSRSSSSTDASVDRLVRVRFVDGRPSSSNRIVSSCFGEPMLNSWPTKVVDPRLETRERSRRTPRSWRRARRGRADPRDLHAGQHRQERHLDLVEQVRDSPASVSSGSRTRAAEQRGERLGGRAARHRHAPRRRSPAMSGFGGSSAPKRGRDDVVDRLRAERGIDHVAGDERVEAKVPRASTPDRRHSVVIELLQVMADADAVLAIEPAGSRSSAMRRRVARHVPRAPVRAGQGDAEQRRSSGRPLPTAHPSPMRVAVRRQPRRPSASRSSAVAHDTRVDVLDRAAGVGERVGPLGRLAPSALRAPGPARRAGRG